MLYSCLEFPILDIGDSFRVGKKKQKKQRLTFEDISFGKVFALHIHLRNIVVSQDPRCDSCLFCFTTDCG